LGAVSERADRGANGVQADSAEWAFARVPRRPRDVVLDVGAGNGLGGRSLAGEVRQVIVVGASETSVEAGRAEAAAAGIANIVFMRGDAASLPFPDKAFRVVLSRCALHHFPDPSAELSEIRRVMEPRGWLGLADLVASEHRTVAARQNRIERLRDPSHARALSASELQDTVVRCGYEVTGAETREVRRPLDAWLEQTGTPARAAAEIRTLLRAEADGGEPTGLAPQLEPDGSLSFAHTLTSLLVLNRDV
jgi:SAM-dependent methyltransferase